MASLKPSLVDAGREATLVEKSAMKFHANASSAASTVASASTVNGLLLHGVGIAGRTFNEPPPYPSGRPAAYTISSSSINKFTGQQQVTLDLSSDPMLACTWPLTTLLRPMRASAGYPLSRQRVSPCRTFSPILLLFSEPTGASRSPTLEPKTKLPFLALGLRPPIPVFCR